MHEQRLATATPDPLAEFNGSASQQGRAVVERRGRPLPDCADSVQYRHIQSDLLSKCNPAVEHSASRHLPAISRQFQDPSQQFPFHLSATGGRPVFIICTALFLSEVTVHCLLHGFLDTHLLIHSCAILLGIESAPLSEDEDEDHQLLDQPLQCSLWMSCRHIHGRYHGRLDCTMVVAIIGGPLDMASGPAGDAWQSVHSRSPPRLTANEAY